MGRKIIWLLSIVLVGCTLPAGNYILIPADNITPDYTHCEGSECWSVDIQNVPTQEIATFVTATPSFPKCEVRAGLNVRYYDRPIGTALGFLETGQTYFPLEIDENLWIRLEVGWVIISDSFPLFDNEACMDMVPPLLIVTAIPYPTPTAIQTLYVCPKFDAVNVRASETTSSSILGVLQSGQRVLLYSPRKDWYQVSYKGLTGYTHKDFSVLCTAGILQ